MTACMTTLAISAPQPNAGTITCPSLTRICSLLAGSMIPARGSCPNTPGALVASSVLLTPISASGRAASRSAAGEQEFATPPSWHGVSVRRWILPGMARFEGQDLTDAEFRECDLTRARLIGVVMRDAVIDGLVTNLVVNGVEVMSYVEAELDRRHPVRRLIRSADPADLA